MEYQNLHQTTFWLNYFIMHIHFIFYYNSVTIIQIAYQECKMLTFFRNYLTVQNCMENLLVACFEIASSIWILPVYYTPGYADKLSNSELLDAYYIYILISLFNWLNYLCIVILNSKSALSFKDKNVWWSSYKQTVSRTLTGKNPIYCQKML